MRRAAICIALVLALAGCGGRQALKPLPGEGTPPIPRGAERPLTPQEMMTPGPQARPERNADPLRRSEIRGDDPFDLPPGATPTVPADPAGDTDQP